MNRLNRAIRGIAASLALAAATMAGEAPARWSEDKAADWYQRQAWPVGFNFLPSTAVNDTEMWQAETFDPKTIDRELSWARGLGFNSCRAFLQYIVWQADAEGFKKRFGQFLELADRHGLSVMPILFDDCAFAGREPYPGKQDAPVPGVHNSGWVPSPGLKRVTDQAAWGDLEKYVKDVVGSFARDRRVIAWDLYNEPGNSDMGDKSLPLVEASFRWARAASPSQPLTVATWSGNLTNLNRVQLEQSDVLSFHNYGGLEGFVAQIAAMKKHRRPVLCTEWMSRVLGSRFESHLPVMQREKVGAYNWGLVAGRTQTYYPWGSAKGAPEPALWHHDIFRRDGTPFSAPEVAFIRKTTNAPGVTRLKPLFDFPVRDTCVCVAPDAYYLTGTTGAPTWWETNEGIRIWRSTDLKKWEPLGLVWSFEKDGTWQKKVVNGRRALWAPELHYLKGTFWLTYCLNYEGGGTGLLKSTTGKAEGPYVDVKPDGPLTNEIDASLFQDDDGTVYWVYQNGKIARMKEDMTGLAEEPRLLKPANAGQVGFEGAFIFKANGRYHLVCADFVQDEYHCLVASSDKLMGPYGDRFLAVPHGGHNMFFRDKSGAWWSTFFGNDAHAPFRERPAILPVEFGLGSEVRPRIGSGAAEATKHADARKSWSAKDGQDDVYFNVQPERSDADVAAARAEIPPVTHVPPPDRWDSLPISRARLAETGGTWRVVMLGDSIVNDTWRSRFGESLQARLPNTTLELTAVVGGGKGCWWYAREGRVSRHVAPLKPDLLIIGGISHNRDIDAVRAVIREIRKDGPVDVLLCTGPFGAVDPTDAAAWKREREDEKAWHVALAALAREEKAGFLDLQLLWGNYTQAAGKPVDWFKRDVVHANARGEAVLGRFMTEQLSP